MRKLMYAAIAGLFLSAAAMADADIPGKEVALNIAEQPIADALNEFGRQAGLHVVLYSEVARGMKSHSLAGTLTPQAALQALLRDSGLRYEFLDGRTVAILPESQRLPAKQVSAQRISALSPLSSEEQITSSQGERLDEDQKSTASAETGGTKISEVIVTATRREERLQDVPVSMSVLTAEDISRRGLISSEDYLRGIPGVNQSEMVPSGQAIIIRGLETQVASQNYFAGPTTATYFGETPTTTSAGLNASNVDVKLIDIERIEVLRGPQGTAFGSSSMGGAVRTIPAAPKLDRLEGRVGADYSVTSDNGGDNYMFQAIGNLPLIKDKLALRAVAYRFQDSGYYKNVAGSDTAFQASYVIPNGLQGFATDENHAGDYNVEGGRIAALYQPTQNLKLTLSYLQQTTESDGFPIQTSGNYEQTLIQVAPEHVRRGQTSGLNDFDLEIANAVLEYDFGWADLVATYSYIKGESLSIAPYGAQGITSTAWAASAYRFFPHRDDVGEIRLATKFDGAWNFLAGLYADKQYNAQDLDITWHGTPNPYSQRTGIISYLNQRDLRQQAGFAEVSWEFLPRFTLTGGVREYRYERVNVTAQGGPLLGGVSSSSREENEASGRNLRANMSFKPTDNGLLYAGWAQGFRLGQPLPPIPSGLCDVDNNGIVDNTNISLASALQLDSDSVDSYELGAKFSLLDRRVTLDGAVFRMDWADIPVHQFLTCGWNHYFNAGTARSEGVELQASIRMTESVRADLGASYVNARLTQDVPAEGFRSGDRLPGAPKVNGSIGLQYEFHIADHDAFVRTDAIYVGPFNTQVVQTPQSRAGDYVKINATARVMFNSLNVDVYVHNLTDEDAFTSRGQASLSELNGYRLRPRTIGFQLGYNF